MSRLQYVWDVVSDTVVAEFLDSDTQHPQISTVNPQRLAGLVSQQSLNGPVYFHFDSLGSQTATTNESQTITSENLYGAFGVDEGAVGNVGTSVKFRGEYGIATLERVGLASAKRRCYSPSIGRWLSKDPWGLFDGPNHYVPYFVPGGQDPSGLFTTCDTTNNQCAGKPSGVVYKPNRGQFLSLSLEPVTRSDKRGITRSLGAVVGAVWVADLKAFMNEDGDLCCDSIGIIQIARTYDRKANGSKQQTHWFIDALSAAGIAGLIYPKGDKPNIKDLKSNPTYLYHDDQPERSTGGLSSPFVSVNFKSEACVVCVEGNEGLQTKADIGHAYTVEKRISGITVYGCFSWGWQSFQIGNTAGAYPKDWIWYLELAGQEKFANPQNHHDDNAVANKIEISTYQGIEPSDTWTKVVLSERL